MNARLAARPIPSSTLLQRLRDAGPRLRQFSAVDDEKGAFPMHALALLTELGLGCAVLPPDNGGLALGRERNVTGTLIETLRLLGAFHLSVARLYEGHVNAFQLLWRHGDAMQRTRVCHYVEQGGWLGVWNAPHPSGPCRLVAEPPYGFRLQGCKAYASGAGGMARALVTATDHTGTLRMLWPDVRDALVAWDTWPAQGMRASATLAVDFTGLRVAPDDVFGRDDVYHHEPAFSGGAWRFLAAQLGAGEELFDLTRQDLVRSGRASDPHQRSRLARAGIALRSALNWIESAAWRAESIHHSQASIQATIAHVAMARSFVDASLHEVMQLCERCIGLRAQLRDHPMERVSRDLRTYLHQPAPDAVLDRVAQAWIDETVSIRDTTL
jgi:alkylation response protein AidB-like acyl-CoA dehydrogenase